MAETKNEPQSSRKAQKKDKGEKKKGAQKLQPVNAVKGPSNTGIKQPPAEKKSPKGCLLKGCLLFLLLGLIGTIPYACMGFPSSTEIANNQENNNQSNDTGYQVYNEGKLEINPIESTDSSITFSVRNNDNDKTIDYVIDSIESSIRTYEIDAEGLYGPYRLTEEGSDSNQFDFYMKPLESTNYTLEASSGADISKITFNFTQNIFNGNSPKVDNTEDLLLVFAKDGNPVPSEESTKNSKTTNESSTSRSSNTAEAKAEAMTAFERYGKIMFPYGFKPHFILGQIACDQSSDGSWFLKYECDITNEYGATMKDVVVEATIVGSPENPEVTYFYPYLY